MADDGGRPRPVLVDLYRQLARGGAGLVITGHMFVTAGGKCHAEMTGIYDDALVPDLAMLAGAVRDAGGKVAVQINHGGMQCSRETVAETVAPSDIAADFLQQPARALEYSEILDIVDAFSQAARRAQLAGFDAVQLHGAHGYLINQFLSPFTNRRVDDWGGSLENRMRFLREIVQAVRDQVGADYPILIKLGLADALDAGLSFDDGLAVVSALDEMGLDGVEISGGIGGRRDFNSRSRIRKPEEEAYFRDWARAARAHTRLPLILVGGLRSRAVMEDVLASGDADFVSLCRPLICEPDLPERLRAGQTRAACISGNRCWPMDLQEGIACKCCLT